MVDGVALLMAPFFMALRSGFFTDERGSNLLDSGAPFYDSYPCADGATWPWLEPQFFAALLDGLRIDPAEVGDQHDRSGWPPLRARLGAAFATRSRDEWVAHFAGRDACVAPVLTTEETLADPHLAAGARWSSGTECPSRRPHPVRGDARRPRPPAAAAGGAHRRDPGRAGLPARGGKGPAGRRGGCVASRVAGRYSFGDSDVAARRLALVAQVFEPTSRALLAESVPPGATSRSTSAAGRGTRPGCWPRPARSTLGLDGSERYVAAARAGTDDPAVSFACHDVTSLPLPQAPADVVYARLLLAHLPGAPAVAEVADPVAAEAACSSSRRSRPSTRPRRAARLRGPGGGRRRRRRRNMYAGPLLAAARRPVPRPGRRRRWRAACSGSTCSPGGTRRWRTASRAGPAPPDRRGPDVAGRGRAGAGHGPLVIRQLAVPG